MKGRAFLLMVGFWLVALVLPTILGGAEKAQTPPPGARIAKAPDVKPGSWWKYRNLTSKLNFKLTLKDIRDSKFIVVSSSFPDREQIYTKEWNPITIVNLFDPAYDLVYDPYSKYYSFPIWPGKRWKQDYQWEVSVRGIRGESSLDVKALEWEKVKVSAGEFLALKISIDIVTESRRGTRYTKLTYWYAPEVRNRVKLETPRANIELVSYELK